MMSDPGYTFKDLAGRLGLSVSTVRRYFADLPRIAYTQRTIRFPESSLQTFFDRHPVYVPQKQKLPRPTGQNETTPRRSAAPGPGAPGRVTSTATASATGPGAKRAR